MFSLESPHRGDSNENTQYNKEKHHIIPDLQLREIFQGIKERIRNSRGKRAISVRATFGSTVVWNEHEFGDTEFTAFTTCFYLFKKQCTKCRICRGVPLIWILVGQGLLRLQ